MSTNENSQFDPNFTKAVDTLVDNAFDLNAVPQDQQDNASKIMQVVALLDHLEAEPTGDLLVQRTLQAIEQSGKPQSTQTPASSAALPPATPMNISPADEEALDALIEAGFELSAVSAEYKPRAERISNVIETLDELPSELTAPAPMSLIQDTLAKIDDHERKERLSYQINSMAMGTGAGSSAGGLRWTELFAMAAMFLVGISLFWPMIDHSNAVARQAVCQSNLMAAGMGMLAYSNDNNGAMPSVQARLGDEWWRNNTFDNHGNTLSNSAHLYKLYGNGSESGYASVSALNCPENQFAPTALAAGMRDWSSSKATSFAYQNQYSLHKPKLNGTIRIVLLSDKNPYFTSGKYQMNLDRNANSKNHAKLGGQNVLLSSGRVLWLTSPKFNGDNIFQAGDDWQDNYTGREGPASENDAFLVNP